jgi:Cysteine rich repeat
MLRTMLAVSAALMLIGSIATAQTRAAVKACAADIKTQCGKFPPGGHKSAECVKTNVKDFSQKCQAALQQAKGVAKECTADIKQNCSNVKPGGSRIEHCLQMHLTGLSDNCKAAISGSASGRT